MSEIKRCMMKTKKNILLLLAVLGLMAFGDPHKRVGSVEGLGNYHQRVTDFTPFAPGEKLDFKLHYGFINAGVASLEVNEADQSVDGKEVLQFLGNGKSGGTFDWFFKVRDEYQSFVDAETTNPLVFKRRVNEGDYHISRDYTFLQEEKLIEDGKNKDKVAVPENVQDILSAFYYARTLDFDKIKVGQVIELYSYMDYEVWPLKVRFKGTEKVKVDAGEFDCLRFVPVVQEGRVFSDEEDLNVYITNDKNRIPVLVKADVLVGSIKMELTKWKGLAHPLAKV